ncbi:uncharacterized protein LOC129788436 isoform X1 [Lutzomyia longipalpis]|nr:uncharacterized protein LOC129788436 isoform X1 [Lutzomyia longipalpis]XP_055680493.1 uncharacterized protein LOC129788436 isoform X1 [Lutzomyia longipalpis]XP_055680494.1 uncharacterized protein LOC129788436 isoform X1 [Lutzomyia longipalpis]
MWHPRVVDLQSSILCLLIAAEVGVALRDVHVTIPAAVKKGDNANLICNYDMEGDILYSVKWYKGRREFYRYTPKENPAMKIFLQPGISVERTLSNESQVVLTAVDTTLSGKFSCEVSADAPSFHTIIVSGDMEIVELPEKRPSIVGVHSRYRVGDLLRGNCTSHFSKPAANLTWTINELPASPLYTTEYKLMKNVNSNLESSVMELHFTIAPNHFLRGKLKLKCFASIHDIYRAYADKLIEQETPRILATGTSGHNANLFQNTPYDQSSNLDEGTRENYLETDGFVKRYQADLSSASSSSFFKATKAETYLFNTKSYYIAILILIICAGG